MVLLHVTLHNSPEVGLTPVGLARKDSGGPGSPPPLAAQGWPPTNRPSYTRCVVEETLVFSHSSLTNTVVLLLLFLKLCSTPSALTTPSAQILVSEHCSPVEGTWAPWRNGDSRESWGRESIG